jgi:hypothetical protein
MGSRASSPSLTLAALGVFILLFGWFGFNPRFHHSRQRHRRSHCSEYDPRRFRWCDRGSLRLLVEIQET